MGEKYFNGNQIWTIVLIAVIVSVATFLIMNYLNQKDIAFSPNNNNGYGTGGNKPGDTANPSPGNDGSYEGGKDKNGNAYFISRYKTKTGECKDGCWTRTEYSSDGKSETGKQSGTGNTAAKSSFGFTGQGEYYGPQGQRPGY